MKFFKRQLSFDFEDANWDLDPELLIIHHILERKENVILLAKSCFPKAKEEASGVVGRDGMTLEQIIRCAIFKQYMRMTYKDLARATADSRIGRIFMKMQNDQRFSLQTLQENITKVSIKALCDIHIAIAFYGMELGVDDGKKVRSDSTVIKTNIHHPTNASLLYDCVRVTCKIIKDCKALLPGVRFRSYQKGSKKLLFKIVNTKGNGAKAKRLPLFKKLLKHTASCEKQTNEAIDILGGYVFNNPADERQRMKLLHKLEALLPKVQQVMNVAFRREILDESVPVADKLFSIFEDHTDCIVKGNRKVIFGHKLNFTVGDSHLIFDCIIKRGNTADTEFFTDTIDNLYDNLELVPDSIVGDGGFASIANRDYAVLKNIKNIVFNKVKGSLQNIVSSKNMETRLKKWRAGIEAMISNFKRGLKASLCNWKGWEAFQKFVLWNVITFNLRIIGRSVVNSIAS